ncbi:hypothetical protein KKB69_00005 [Patescibacteria group bacterium]|nr:hypothetical protein [Patescibacteria group bacterium]
MNVITIPKKLAQKDDLIILPRKEYEKFLNWQKNIKIFKATLAQKKDLAQARKDFTKGKLINLEDLK